MTRHGFPEKNGCEGCSSELPGASVAGKMGPSVWGLTPIRVGGIPKYFFGFAVRHTIVGQKLKAPNSKIIIYDPY